MMRVLGSIFALLACAGLSPTQAAPSSFGVSGAAAKGCRPTMTSVTVTVSTNSHSVTTETFSPASIAVWCNTAGTLSIASTRLLKSGTTNNFADYTLSVTGWGSAFTYATAPALPAASTESSTTQSATLSFACTAGCTSATIAKNTTYTATIIVGLSPN